MKIKPAAWCVLLICGFAGTARGGDWSAYRHDVQRTATTGESPAFPLHAAWVYRAAQAPRPAWPEPFHLLNRLDFDYAPHPVTGGGMVYFGSTADDAVRALDEKTGEPRWAFVTGGPVRFAPQYVAGKLYVGADDGFTYCLEAASGKLIWKFHAAPYGDMLVGNGRMMSRWPMRTGVLVMEDTVYVVAGMWNADGVHVCALNAQTGAVVWRNDNAGYTGVFFKGSGKPRTDPVASIPANTTHDGEFGTTGINPQGPLLATADSLIVPNGMGFPSRFNRHTGQYKPWERSFSPAPGVGGVVGGTWACVDNGYLYSLTKYRQDVLGLFWAVADPEGSGKELRAKIIPPNVTIRPWGVGSNKYRPADYIHDKGKASIVVSKGKAYARHAYALTLTGSTLLLGLDGAVVAQDAATEKEIWRAPVEGIAREIAVANGRIFVSTEAGVMHCFEGGEPTAAATIHHPAPAQHQPMTASAPAANVIAQLRAGGVNRGFALVLGDADAALSLSVARATELNVINVQRDEASTDRLRNRLLTTTDLYGTRVHVLTVDRMDELPFARYFANAVILAGPLPEPIGKMPATARELYRVLRPYGGLLLTPGLSADDASAFIKETGASDEERAKVPNAIVRGAIAGARDWNSSTAPDRAMAGPARVLWFGGPDTMQTQLFHESATPPTVVNGRYLVLAENRLSAVDAYNGTVQWSRIIPRCNANLCVVDGVIYHVKDNRGTGANPKADEDRSTRGGGPSVQNAQDGEPADGATSDKALDAGTNGHAKLATVVNDAEMVSMDETTSTNGGRSLRVAGADTAYLVLGRGDPESEWIEFDVRTGTQTRVFTKWKPAPVVSLRKPQRWKVAIDDSRSGTVTAEADAKGLLLTLTTQDKVVTSLDRWDLFFDFRRPEQRAGLYEDGAFQLTVIPAQRPGAGSTCRNGNGPRHPLAEVAGERTADGSKTSLRLPWKELENIAGGRPESFGFAATLSSHDGGKEEHIVRRHLFGDWASEAMNNGWANIYVGAAPAQTDNTVAATPAVVGPLTREIWKQARDPSFATLRTPPTLDAAAALGLRIHPLTGEPEPKIYRAGTGRCGGPNDAATERFGRATGNLGLYDFVDDSGLRNLCGVKAGCSTSIMPALGVVIISPEGGHCVCSYPLATTVTLGPSDRRLNEDWAIFHDRAADTLIRQAAINFGAFGDRRDDRGTLWLGFPRPPERAMNFSLDPLTSKAATGPGVWMHDMPAAMQVPLTIEYLDPAKGSRPQDDLVDYGYWASWSPNRLNKEYGPYRVNTDVVTIRGADRPWLYGSGYIGIKKATLALDFRTPLIAANATHKPTIDGKVDESEWGDKPDHVLPFTKTKVHLRQDAEHLYIALKRPSFTNRLGKVAPWWKTAKGDDATIWNDDSCEVFLSDATIGRVVHFGVSASGARYDALSSAEPADGKPEAKEDAGWNGSWTSATTSDDSSLAFELAIPFKTLAGAGLNPSKLSINLQINQRDVSGEVFMYPAGPNRPPSKEATGEALCYLGAEGRQHCRNFVPLGLGAPPTVPPRLFTVRLHFADLDNTEPGRRVFDVKLQDKLVIKGLDIIKEAGGPRVALVKEFNHVSAGDSLTIEMTPTGPETKPHAPPILSAMEIIEEGFTPLTATRPRPSEIR